MSCVAGAHSPLCLSGRENQDSSSLTTDLVCSGFSQKACFSGHLALFMIALSMGESRGKEFPGQLCVKHVL